MSTKKTASKLKNWQPNPDITPEQLEVMRVEVYDRIIVARLGCCCVTRFLVIWLHVCAFWQQMIGCLLLP
jgi:hypothetical protein